MRETLDFIQKDISSRKKIRSVIITIALFIVALIPSILLTSYSFYVNSNTGLVIGGTVSTSSGDADIKLTVYMQDRDSNGNPVAESYSKIYFIPINEYSYNSSRSSCTNGVSIDSFENGKFTLTASQKGYCDVYFDALESDIIKSSPNGIIRLFAEQNPGEGDYKEVGQVPSDNYVINEAKTSQTCPNVTLEGRNISITASGDINCLIYLDLETVQITNIDYKFSEVTNEIRAVTINSDEKIDKYYFRVNRVSSAEASPTNYSNFVEVSSLPYNLESLFSVCFSDEIKIEAYVKTKSGLRSPIFVINNIEASEGHSIPWICRVSELDDDIPDL